MPSWYASTVGGRGRATTLSGENVVARSTTRRAGLSAPSWPGEFTAVEFEITGATTPTTGAAAAAASDPAARG